MPVTNVFLLALAIGVVAYLLAPFHTYSKQVFAGLGVSAIALTLASHVVTSTRFAGMGTFTVSYGWPHAWFMNHVDFTAMTNRTVFAPGPFGAYLIADLLFYFAVSAFLYGLVRRFSK